MAVQKRLEKLAQKEKDLEELQALKEWKFKEKRAEFMVSLCIWYGLCLEMLTETKHRLRMEGLDSEEMLENGRPPKRRRRHSNDISGMDIFPANTLRPKEEVFDVTIDMDVDQPSNQVIVRACWCQGYSQDTPTELIKALDHLSTLATI